MSGPWEVKSEILKEKLIVESYHYLSVNIYLFEMYHIMLHFYFIGFILLFV